MSITRAPIGTRVFSKLMMVRGYRTSNEGRLFEVYLAIDIDEIMAQLAPKALRNKSKQSRYASNAIKLRVTLADVAAA